MTICSSQPAEDASEPTANESSPTVATETPEEMEWYFTLDRSKERYDFRLFGVPVGTGGLPAAPSEAP
ncbi:hypothetical protein LJC45_02625 [Alistipes sp. OttesenSCG-928-B03]|nr:hypothetical protein [Alistipes sp. OttesenSCG-928-B03]